MVTLGALFLFLHVTLAVVFCLKRDGISFIVTVSGGAAGKCMRELLLSQWHLLGRAGGATSPAMCRTVPCIGKLFYPIQMLGVPLTGNTDL